jgi:hypothetical protein
LYCCNNLSLSLFSRQNHYHGLTHNCKLWDADQPWIYCWQSPSELSNFLCNYLRL